MIEIFMVIEMFMLTIGSINYHANEKTMLHNSNADDCVILSYKNANDEKSHERVNELMGEDDNILGVGKIYGSYMDDEEERININLYDDLVVEKLSLNLKKGIALNEAMGKYKDIVPVIVSSDIEKKYNYGKEYTIKYLNKDIRIAVVGVLNNKNIGYRFLSSGTALTFDYILKKTEHNIIMPKSYFGDEAFYEDNLTNIISLKDIEGEAFENTLDSLDELGDVRKFNELKVLSQQVFMKNCGSYFFNFIIVFTMCITGILGFNLYMQKQQQKQNSIYFVSGATMKDIMIIQGLQGIMILVIPFIMGYVYTITVLFERTEYSLLLLSQWDCLWILLIISIIYIVSYVPYNMKIMKTQPVELLRSFE